MGEQPRHSAAPHGGRASGLPDPVQADLAGEIKGYWRRRIAQCFRDSYAGLPLMKLPEDLRVYEHLLWMQRPDVVIEVGTFAGASALWFRDRLVALARYRSGAAPRVVSVDVNQGTARAVLAQVDPRYEEDIALVEGDVRDPALAGRIRERVPEGASCLVVEDSAHTYDVTLAALRSLAGFVAPGGFFVAEDGCVDVEELRLEPDWPRGVLPAIGDWLAEGGEGRHFVVRRDLEIYGISCHPGGFLQRRV